MNFPLKGKYTFNVLGRPELNIIEFCSCFDLNKNKKYITKGKINLVQIVRYLIENKIKYLI